MPTEVLYLLAALVPLASLGGGLYLGYRLGGGDVERLTAEVQALKLEVARVRAAGQVVVDADRKVTDALSDPDPRRGLRGLLDAGGTSGPTA